MFLSVFASFFSQGTIFIIVAVSAFIFVIYVLAALILFAKKKLIPNDHCFLKINSNSQTCSIVAGKTLLTALGQEGITLPSPCGGKASCKQCRVQVIEGASVPLETDKATFSKKQLKEGWRLSCQLKIKNDLHVHIEKRFLEIKEWYGEVLSNENVATFIKELVIKLPEGCTIPYRSGGYMQFHVPGFKTCTTEWKQSMNPKFFSDWEKFQLFEHSMDFSHLDTENIVRAYSMASYPGENGILKFNIRIATPPIVKGIWDKKIPWGICSSYCFSLKKGDKIKLSGPYGESFMVDDMKPLIFLIGGAGSSFGRSHVLHLFHTEQTKREVDFWYGARSLKENIYQNEYEKLDAECSNFRYHLVLSEPLEEDIQAGWPKDNPIKTNYLFRAFEQGQLKMMKEPQEALYFICGPPLHNSSLLKLLDDYGVPRENIVLDDFGS